MIEDNVLTCDKCHHVIATRTVNGSIRLNVLPPGLAIDVDKDKNLSAICSQCGFKTPFDKSFIGVK